jgi:DNA-binding NarL/FixJ family response regulator
VSLLLQEKETTMQQELKPFLERLQRYALHVHVQKWQEEQFAANLAALKPGEVLIDMDFSMNVTFRAYRELQSEHWTHPMASLFDAGE